MHELAALIFLNIHNVKLGAVSDDQTMVSYLATHFCVKRSLIQNQNGFTAGNDLISEALLCHNG